MEQTQQVWDLSKYDRGPKNMTGHVIWITGLSGAGKTTLAEELNIRLQKKNMHVCIIIIDRRRSLSSSSW